MASQRSHFVNVGSLERPSPIPLALKGERLCLDFTNTKSGRGSSHELDHLQTFDDLMDWAEHAGVFAQARCDALRAISSERIAESQIVLQDAVGLRETLYRVFMAITEQAPDRNGHPPQPPCHQLTEGLNLAAERPCAGPTPAGSSLDCLALPLHHQQRKPAMPQADQGTIDLLTDYFDAMEAKDHERLGSYYADNITLTFANAPTITGRDAIQEAQDHQDDSCSRADPALPELQRRVARRPGPVQGRRARLHAAAGPGRGRNRLRIQTEVGWRAGVVPRLD